MVRLCLALSITAFFILYYFSYNAPYTLPDDAFVGNSILEK